MLAHVAQRFLDLAIVSTRDNEFTIPWKIRPTPQCFQELGPLFIVRGTFIQSIDDDTEGRGARTPRVALHGLRNQLFKLFLDINVLNVSHALLQNLHDDFLQPWIKVRQIKRDLSPDDIRVSETSHVALKEESWTAVLGCNGR